MPRLPTNDSADFDGFRLTGKPLRPPSIKQASLVKSPASLRRDSLAASPLENGAPEECCLSFIFDAARPGKLSVHLRVVESPEVPLPTAQQQEEQAPRHCPIDLIPQAQDGCEDTGSANESESPGDAAIDVGDGASGLKKKMYLRPVKNLEAEGLVLDTFHFEAGLNQEYRSPGMGLANWPARLLGFEASRPREIPVAIRLEADPVEGEPATVQYTYVTWRTVSSGGDVDSSSSPQQQQWKPEIFSQKLQYGEQRFVLQEVFGVKSKAASAGGEAEVVETGNNDCIICLSEPRDTAVFPCRHMCFCSYCAGIVRLQCDKCPVCRQKVVSLLQFKREGDNGESHEPPTITSSPETFSSFSPSGGVHNSPFNHPEGAAEPHHATLGASSSTSSSAVLGLRPGCRR